GLLAAGLASAGTGRFEKMIELSNKLPPQPDNIFGYLGPASSYFFLDRFPEAEGKLQQASEHKLESPYLLVIRYSIAVLKNDKNQMERVEALAKGKPRAEHGMAHAEALALVRS